MSSLHEEDVGINITCPNCNNTYYETWHELWYAYNNKVDYYRFTCHHCGKMFNLEINLKFHEVFPCPLCEEISEKVRHTINKLECENGKTCVKIFQEYICGNCKPDEPVETKPKKKKK